MLSHLKQDLVSIFRISTESCMETDVCIHALDLEISKCGRRACDRHLSSSLFEVRHFSAFRSRQMEIPTVRAVAVTDLVMICVIVLVVVVFGLGT